MEIVTAHFRKKGSENCSGKRFNSRKNVAHPDCPITFELISVDGDTATVGLKAEDTPDKKEVRRQFPLKELFNPYTARELMTSVMEDELNKSALPGCGVMAVEL